MRSWTGSNSESAERFTSVRVDVALRRDLVGRRSRGLLEGLLPEVFEGFLRNTTSEVE